MFLFRAVFICLHLFGACQFEGVNDVKVFGLIVFFNFLHCSMENC